MNVNSLFNKNSGYLIYSDKTGGITFGDFMEFLSVITKGTVRDKLLWTFTFYDVDHDGVISKDEMLKVWKLNVKLTVVQYHIL